jgi:sulfoxide reductase heme-binding subunit YedZ
MSHRDPTFWLLARAAGLTAFVLLTASMVAGLTLKSRLLGRAVRPAAITDVHRSLAIAGLGALALHGIALVLDSTVTITPFALVVPGLSPYRPVLTGVGVVAGELMALVTASFWARKRIGTKVWRRLHWLSYAAFLAACAHGIGTGSDSGRPGVAAVYAVALGAVVAGTAWRALSAGTRRPSPRRGSRTPVERVRTDALRERERSQRSLRRSLREG